jgi:hypothetical protein
MIFNQELKDKIEDALIHFEDAGYKFLSHYEFFLDSNVGNKTYDLLKKIEHNDKVEFGDRIIVRIYRDKIMNWKEYQFYQSQLKTAITRMTNDVEKVQISETDYTDILIPGRTWKFKNIADLTAKCRYFGGNLVIYPEFHNEEGIAVYVREILTKPGEKRFDIFNDFLSSDEINVSIERAFGKDCVEKMYEEGEAEKENPYLSQSQLSKYIVAKIKCDFIKV